MVSFWMPNLWEKTWEKQVYDQWLKQEKYSSKGLIKNKTDLLNLWRETEHISSTGEGNWNKFYALMQIMTNGKLAKNQGLISRIE